MSGTHRDLLFGSKSRCFAWKNHRWGLGPIETSNSFAKDAVFQAQNDRWCLGPIEICYSGPKVAVMHPKTTREGWDSWRLVILMLITMFCMQNHWRGLGPIETSNSDVKQNEKSCLGPIETFYSGPEVAVLHAKTTGGVYSPAETCNSSPKVAVLHPKTTHEGWDP